MTKRRRRVGKIEDVQIDIDALFEKKKRFKPDDSTSESIGHFNANGALNANAGHPDLQLHLARQSFLGGASSQTRRVMASNLQSQYMEQVGEHDVANQGSLNMFKHMIKTI